MIDATREKFSAELAAFEERKAAWLTAGLEGQWAACSGDSCLGPYKTPGEAWDAGLARWKSPRFLMKCVRERDEPVVISHVALGQQALGRQPS